LLIISAGTVFSLLLGSVWVVTRTRWKQTDLQDPRKDLANEVLHAVGSYMPWATPNGSRFQAASHRLWTKLVRPHRDVA
jgi:hypothetical protein